MNARQHEWEIGLSSWIIQDGNFADFETGRKAKFALEFFPQSVRLSDVTSKSAIRRDAAKYEINGEIVLLAAKVWVLDFGIRAFQNSAPPTGVSAGQFVAAEIYLGIDPFYYIEELFTLPGMPPLIYSWKVNSIAQETAPLIESLKPSGQKVLIRDKNKLGYKTIPKTDAWKDDDGHGEYVLTCERLDIPPKFESETAT